MVLEVIPEVEKRLIGSKKVGSWLTFCCKKHLEVIHGVEDRLWKYSQRVEDGLWKFTPKVEESPLGSIKVGSWLRNAHMSLLRPQELTVS